MFKGYVSFLEGRYSILFGLSWKTTVHENETAQNSSTLKPLQNATRRRRYVEGSFGQSATFGRQTAGPWGWPRPHKASVSETNFMQVHATGTPSRMVHVQHNGKRLDLGVECWCRNYWRPTIKTNSALKPPYEVARPGNTSSSLSCSAIDACWRDIGSFWIAASTTSWTYSNTSQHNGFSTCQIHHMQPTPCE